MHKDDAIFYGFLGASGMLIVGGLFVAGGLVVVAAGPMIMAWIWRKAVVKKEGQNQP